MRRLLALASCALLIITVKATAQDVDYRLPSYVQPTFQSIHLNLNPDQPDFSGSTNIHIEIRNPTKKVGFYQLGLDISKAELHSNKQVIPMDVTSADYDINWATAEHTLQPGNYMLRLSFSGKVNTSSDGMYLSTFEDRNYIFTQFEDMHARRAFPSFDEPGFKFPYQMTITSPESQVVVSNTPVETREVNDGRQTVTFMKTKPMPSYLVAYAVGHFDSVELTGLSVPGRIYVPKGYQDKTKFVVKHTPDILMSLEHFFGIDYPYRKLDFVAVPNFTHGAMENAGLITYRDSLLLLEDEPGLAERSAPLNVIAHELAHQWYGNLVTMAWWDDLWLNEAFASWMASYVMMELYPELNFRDRIIQEGAFGADASPTVKPVKKVVRRQPEVMDGLGLNYSKGESILQMIESLIGTENFRTGIRAYMKKHAWGNAQADDLWSALDAVSDFNLSAMMKAYLEQPGYPLIEITDKGTISQQRFHLAGAVVEQQNWAVPLNISVKKDGKITRQIVFVDKPMTQMPQLAEADWVFPNDNAMGYFRWTIPAKQLDNLLRDLDVLNNREKKNVLYNMQALLNGGKVGIDAVMKVLNALAQDDDPVVIRASISILNEFLYLVNDDNKMAFAKLLNDKYMPLLDKLTLNQGAQDSESVIRLRNQLFALLGHHGENAALVSKSEMLAQQYINDTSSVPSGIARTALSVTTEQADNLAWFDKIVASFRASQLPNVKNTLLYSMQFTDDATVKKILNLALGDDVTPANTIYLVATVANNLDDQTVLYEWLAANSEALLAKMPAYHISRMPEFVSTTCEEDNLNLASVFYQTIKQQHDGMSRSYDIMVDESQQCIRLKQTYQADFDRFLALQ